MILFGSICVEKDFVNDQLGAHPVQYIPTPSKSAEPEPLIRRYMRPSSRKKRQAAVRRDMDR